MALQDDGIEERNNNNDQVDAGVEEEVEQLMSQYVTAHNGVVNNRTWKLTLASEKSSSSRFFFSSSPMLFFCSSRSFVRSLAEARIVSMS